MELARRLHGRPDPRTPGLILDHGPSYDLFAAAFFGGRRRQVFTRLAAMSGARPGDRVLDVGSGTGYFTRIMAEAVGPNGAAVGVDPSASGVERSRRATRLSNCTFVEGVAEALDFTDGPFDVVVTSLMMHHLPEDLRSQAIAEMLRVLRPGGRVLVADFRPPTSRVGRRLIGAITGPAMETNPVHLLEPMVRGAGFEQVSTGYVRPWMHYVYGEKLELR